MERLHLQPDLAALLDEHRAKIAIAWSDLLRELPDSHYQDRSEEELSSWTQSGLVAIAEALRTGSKEPLIDHAARASKERRQLGFTINEVVEGLLLMRDAAIEHLRVAHPPTATFFDDSWRQFDVALRVLIARFALVFAEGMKRSLADERDRTAFLLEASEAAGSSLDLSVVLPPVARNLMKILGQAHCSIYLWEDSEALFRPRVAIGEIAEPRLKAALRESLDPQRELIAREAVSAEGISTYSATSDYHLGGHSFAALGIASATVVPFRLADSVVAFALALGMDPGAGSDPRALDLAVGIANSVAPAVANARTFAEVRKRLGESERLKEAAEALLEMKGLEDLAEIICREAETLADAKGSAVVLTQEGAVPMLTFRHGDVEGLGERDLLDGDFRPAGVWRLPLAVRGHVLGTLFLLPRETGLERETRRLLSGFADQAAIAIQHALLHRRDEELAILRERQKLAHELHDSVTQSIHGVTMYAEAAGRLLDVGEIRRTTEILRELRDAALQSLREMRMLVFELRPTLLEEEGLAAALQARLSAVEDRGGLATDFVARGVKSPPVRHAEALYGIAKEALNNVLRHAGASRVSVRLQQSDSILILEITDDGAGFETSTVGSKGGLGLQGMQERAASIGAHLSLISTPGTGTTVRVEVPMPTTTETVSVSEVMA